MVQGAHSQRFRVILGQGAGLVSKIELVQEMLPDVSLYHDTQSNDQAGDLYPFPKVPSWYHIDLKSQIVGGVEILKVQNL